MIKTTKTINATPIKKDRLFMRGLVVVVIGFIFMPVLGFYVGIAVMVIGILMIIVELLAKLDDKKIKG